MSWRFAPLSAVHSSMFRACQWLVCIACLYAFGTCALFCIHCDSTLRAFQRLVCIACLYAFETCAFFCIIATQHFGAFQQLVRSACLYAFGTCALFCIHCDSALRAFQRLVRSACLYAFGTCALFCIHATQRFALSSGLCIPLACPHIWLPGHRASPSRRAAKILAARAPVNRRTACRHARPGR